VAKEGHPYKLILMMVSRVKRIVFACAWALAAGLLLEATLHARGDLARDEGPGATQRNTREEASFPHGSAKHKTLECSKCHSVTTAQPEVRKFPGHSSCSSCHNLALEALSKPVLFCGICHEARPASRQRAALFQFPKPRVETDFGADFSHPSHLKPMPASALSTSQTQTGLQTPRCTDCHQRISQPAAGTPEMRIETGHSSCFKCHGEQPVKPPSMNQCAECHALDGARAPHLFASVKSFKHEDHEFDIRPRKKREYPLSKAPDYLCSECHSSVVTAARLDHIKLPEASYCAQCHNGRLGLPDSLVQEVLNDLRKR
jgi:hypothetical protein